MISSARRMSDLPHNRRLFLYSDRYVSLDESFKSCSFLPEHLREESYSVPSPGNTAFNKAFSSPLNFYTYCTAEDPEKGTRFSRAMSEVAQAHLNFFETAYPIQQLPESRPIIDVAGGFGQTAIYLAERLQCENFLVLDFPSVVEQGKRRCPPALNSRIRFEAHDMFQPYPNLDNRQGAPVFLLKAVLHDWSDADCIRILSNLAVGMGDSGSILIIETVKPAIGVSISTAVSELTTMSMFGGRHRTYEEFEDLIKAVDSSLDVRSYYGNAGQHDDMLVLEVSKCVRDKSELHNRSE